MSTWIIDGNNLIYRDPRLRAILQESGFEAARGLLEGELGRRRSGQRFHVVYDGGSAGRRGGVTVAIAAPGRTADDEILRIARSLDGKETVRIVTSDRHDIGERLRGLAAEWVSVETFRPILWGTHGTGSVASAGEESDKPALPRGTEVDRWLENFGEERSDGDASRS